MHQKTCSISLAIPADAQVHGARAIDGWPLAQTIFLEEACPGFLLHATRSGPRWRQSYFTLLALKGLENADEFVIRATGEEAAGTERSRLRSLAQLLMSMTGRDLIAALLGQVPGGLCGAFAKLGRRPLPNASAYTRLVAVLTEPSEDAKARRRAIAQLVHLDENLLDVALSLDRVALSPGLVCQIANLDRARRLNAVLDALRVHARATDQALQQSLAARREHFRLSEFVSSWLEKIENTTPVQLALDSHPDFTRVTPASAGRYGRKFRNCLASKRAQLVTGIWSAWVWKDDRLIVSLTELEIGIALTGVHGCENFDPPQSFVNEVKRTLAGLGVILLDRKQVPESVQPLLEQQWGTFRFDDFELA